MNNNKENNPDNLGGLSDLLPAEVLKLVNELLEQQHRTDHPNNGSKIEIVYVASGGQHVDTQINIGDAYPKPKKTSKESDASAKELFNADTPLSALFRENHHEELKSVIESWRPYLIGDDTTVDALAMTHFEFDKKRIYSNRVYYDLLDMDALGALQVSLSQLACYLADHSNLSSSHATLYRQLKKYQQERPL
ncbi:MAG: hypothetical protein ILP23_01065 [Paludibacteraceae bacterium]|nr:hypothetical protein [Paludibacteraceae bacterium]MBP5346093.1 hypothetical protein [Bacteroidales bacterium]